MGRSIVFASTGRLSPPCLSLFCQRETNITRGMKKRFILVAFFITTAAGASLRLTQKTPGATNQAAAPAIELPAMWEYSAPLISPENRKLDKSVSQKDPSLVFFQGKWHVFMTIKLQGRTATEYCSFEDWRKANAAPRSILRLTDSQYYCAPQVFYFTPQIVPASDV